MLQGRRQKHPTYINTHTFVLIAILLRIITQEGVRTLNPQTLCQKFYQDNYYKDDVCEEPRTWARTSGAVLYSHRVRGLQSCRWRHSNFMTLCTTAGCASTPCPFSPHHVLRGSQLNVVSGGRMLRLIVSARKRRKTHGYYFSQAEKPGHLPARTTTLPAWAGISTVCLY